MPRRPEPADLLVEAPLELLQTLRELQEKRKAQVARQMARIDVFAVLGYEPNCKVRHEARQAGVAEEDLPPACGACPQELFHSATEYDVLYGGAAGGGKTKALVMEGIRACIRHPGIRVGAFRRTNPELEESFLAELAEVGFARDLGARWNASKYNLTFPNGSIIMFRYAENLQDATRRQGGQYQLLLFDERNLTPPDVCSFLESRLRSGRRDIPVLGIRSGTNPGGIGHGASKARYVDPTKHGQVVHTDMRGRQVRFIPSKLSDNPHVNEEYARDLDNLPEKMRAAFRDGNWDVFAGQMFCYDNKVEALTGSGWKLISDVEQGELIATLSPEGQMTFAPATRVWRFQFDGDLFVHEGRALNFAVTPGHKMWTHGHRSAPNFRFVPVEDLPDTSVHLRAAANWQGNDPATVTIAAPGTEDVEAPTGGCRACGIEVAVPRKGMCDNCYRAWNRAGRPEDLTIFRNARANPASRFARRKSYTFDTGDWCELLGWYLSEGFTSKASSGSATPGRIVGFGIAQHSDEAKIRQIGELLHRLGLTYSQGRSRYRVSSRVLGEYFAQFGHHADKFIPREVLDLAPRHLQRLFDALMAGDGHRLRGGEGGWILPTTSRRLADDVQELCVRLNLVATVTEIPARGRQSACYRVSVYQPGHDRSILRRSSIRREPYSGLVSCVTVEPHHTVLVRRGGKAMWCGNSEWRHERHTVAPMALPSSARRYVSMDWGFTAPWAVLWGAQDEDGRLWIYREIYRTQVGEADQAKAIVDAEGGDEEIGPRWADDSMWDVRGDAKPIADVYAENGVALTKAGKGPGSRIIGWQRIHSMLKDGPACPHHRAQGWDTCPMMHVFTTCEHLIRTLPTLPHATKGNPEDADTGAEDHAPDALRYMAINIGGGPQFLLEPDEPDTTRLQGVDPESQFGRQLSRTVAVLPNADGTFWEPAATQAGSVVIVGGMA